MSPRIQNENNTTLKIYCSLMKVLITEELGECDGEAIATAQIEARENAILEKLEVKAHSWANAQSKKMEKEQARVDKAKVKADKEADKAQAKAEKEKAKAEKDKAKADSRLKTASPVGANTTQSGTP